MERLPTGFIIPDLSDFIALRELMQVLIPLLLKPGDMKCISHKTLYRFMTEVLRYILYTWFLITHVIVAGQQRVIARTAMGMGEETLKQKPAA